jgi:hypothetical protein
MITINDFVPDYGKIGLELINSEILIDLRIEPYVTLDCFERNGYDILNCVEMNCPKFPECFRRLVYGKYLIIE